jgi:hypothetical protein
MAGQCTALRVTYLVPVFLDLYVHCHVASFFTLEQETWLVSVFTFLKLRQEMCDILTTEDV